MRKKILLLLFSPAIYYSQVGINTSNPQASFHVDGGKNNASTGAPTTVQQSDDFVVSSQGTVGIGIANPAARLHLYNHIAGSNINDDYLFDDESPISNGQALILRRSNAGVNLLNGNIIGSVLFNARVNGSFGYAGAGIQGIHRGNGTIQNNALAFLINSSSEAGRFDEFGNLGVGITVPKEKLDVQGAISFAGQAALNKTAQGTIDYPNPGSTGNQLRLLSWGGDAVTNGIISFWTGFANTNAVERMRIHSNGNVGIGTAAPVAKLDVAGNVKIADGTQGLGKILVSDANGLASWQDASTASNNIYNSNGSLTSDRNANLNGHNLGFTGTGNFGIGTAAPIAKLDVEGNQYLNAAITAATTKNALDINVGQDGLTYGNRTDNFGIIMRTNSSASVGPIARINFGDTHTVSTSGLRYLSFSVGRTLNELLYLTDANGGNIGVGTTSPAAKLDVAGNVKIADGTQGLGKILVSDANGLASWQNASTASTNIYNSNGSLTSDRNADLNGHNLAFTGTGNVGIGIAAPKNLLHLGGAVGSSVTDVAGKKLAVFNSSAGDDFYGLGLNSGVLQFHASSTPAEAPGMVLTNGGRVGINLGSVSPAANLDVAGNVKIADGTQGTGKVLTSDANGLASWKTPPITSNGSPILYVSAKSGTDIFWNNGSGWTDSTPGTLGWHPFVLKLNEATDINNIYDPSTGKITITEEGLYYIDSQISYMNTPSSSNPGFDGTSGHLFCELFISNQPSSIENISVIRGVKSTGNSTININRTVLLKPGDTIQILIYSYETANMNNDHTYPSIQRSVSNFELFKL